MVTPSRSMEHPSMEVLFSFTEGRLDREETWGIVTHLLKGCRSCRSLARSLMVRGGEVPAVDLRGRPV